MHEEIIWAETEINCHEFNMNSITLPNVFYRYYLQIEIIKATEQVNWCMCVYIWATCVYMSKLTWTSKSI